MEQSLVNQNDTTPEQLAAQIASDILERPFGIHGPTTLPQPQKAITNMVVSQMAKMLFDKHEALFVVKTSLAGEYEHVPQMLLLQYYKALSSPDLKWFIPPPYLKSIEDICIRIYFSLTYRYEQNQVDMTERAVKVEASQHQNAGMDIELGASFLKSLLQWKYTVSSLQGLSFINRFQKTDAQIRSYVQSPMSDTEAINSLDRQFESLNKLWAIFYKKPIDPCAKDNNGMVWLDGIKKWFLRTSLWDLIRFLLIIPLLLIDVFLNISRAILSTFNFDRNWFGKKKFRVMFIIYGFDPTHLQAERLRAQLEDLVANPNIVILLVHATGSKAAIASQLALSGS